VGVVGVVAHLEEAAAPHRRLRRLLLEVSLWG